MTVNTNDTVEREVVNGTGPYGFTFRIFDDADLTVVGIEPGTLASATLTLGVDYTVTGANIADGGTVTLTSDAADTYDGYTLDIRSNVQVQQPAALGAQSSLRLSALETALDRVTRQVQDLNRKQLLCLRVPDNENFPTTLLPGVPSREGKFWTFDADGNIQVGTPVSEVLTSALIATTLDSLKRTESEIAAGVTPSNYAYSPQPLNVLRYGSTWDDIQTAIDVVNAGGGGCVYLPAGRYTKGTATTIHMRSNVRLTGDGYKSEIFVPNAASFTDNILKFESISNASVDNIRINGNRANTASGTRYGFYFGGAAQCHISNVYAHACEGDGIHMYDSDGCLVSHCQTWDNLFHGIELEQCRDSMAVGNNCAENLLHGIYVFQGEVGASGSKGLTISANSCHDNTQYGIAVQGSLCQDITVQGNIVRNNAQYGITIFDEVQGAIVSGNIVTLNGYTGIYLFRIKRAIVTGNQLRQNSQDTHGGYQEIHLDSQVGDTTKRSQFNVIVGNIINIDGVTKAAYGIKENSTSDGPNIVQGNSCPVAGSSGTISVLHETGVNNSFLLCKNNYGRVDQNRGSATFNGTGAQTAFVIAHGITPDEPRGVSVTAGSPNASGDFSVATDATNITVTFAVAPTTGTGNVILRWSATT